MLEIRPDTAILVYRQTQAMVNQYDKIHNLNSLQMTDELTKIRRNMESRVQDIDKIVGLVANELWRNALIKARLLLMESLHGVQTKCTWFKDETKKYESRKYDSRKTENTKNYQTNKQTKKMAVQLNNSREKRLRSSVSPSATSLTMTKPPKPKLHQSIFQQRKLLGTIENETVVTIKMTQQQYLQFMKSVKQP